ncbi:MAG TPA: lytic transglycosylase domain-containing protein [Croceibacterium sp.]|nr:lytic transglycosylase domain-containing protein [Croceibacterium sp.]
MLRSATTAMALTALSLAAVPARADVLEIGEAGQARWVAGPAAQAESAPADVSADVVPGIERPASRADLTARLIPGAYAAKVHELAERFDLSPALIEALVWQESRWRERAVSPAGARGLAQLMPGTARELGVNPDDPFANLEGGARYLRQQLDRFDGDVEKALAAYNAGPGRVRAANGIPAIRETQHYVAAVMGRLSHHSRSYE